jgi:hypothetical protein
LFTENTGEFYPEVRRLVGNLARGLKNYPKATNEVLLERELHGWVHLCTRGARKFHQEIAVDSEEDPASGAPTERINFTKPIIKTVAHQWATDYLTRLRSGEEGLGDV